MHARIIQQLAQSLSVIMDIWSIDALLSWNDWTFHCRLDHEICNALMQTGRHTTDNVVQEYNHKRGATLLTM